MKKRASAQDEGDLSSVTPENKADDPLPAWPLAERPGLLIRRLHQLHLALFAAQVRGLVTPVQFSLLSALAARGGADQTTLAADVALDRSTAAATLARMEAHGWIARGRDEADGRARLCRMTEAGHALLAQVEPLAREAHRQTLAALPPEEARHLMALMRAALASRAR
jgi:DNA-binding MarR family transcriptional regulator